MSQSLSYLIQRLKPYWLSTAGAAVALSVLEGPDIDLVTTPLTVTVGRGGDTILRFDNGGNPVAEWAPTEAGITAALAAAGSGDIVRIPSYSIALTGVLAIPAGVELQGMAMHQSIITGYGFTMGSGSKLADISLTISRSSAGEIIGVENSVTGTSYVRDCNISVTNSGAGDAIGVSAENALVAGEGILIVERSYLYADATGGGSGYAGRSSAGRLYVFHRRAYGSTDRFIVV